MGEVILFSIFGFVIGLITCLLSFGTREDKRQDDVVVKVEPLDIIYIKADIMGIKAELESLREGSEKKSSFTSDG